MKYDKYFDKINYYQSKGKGLSVFNSNQDNVREFENHLIQKNISHQTIFTSELHKTNNFPDIKNSTFKHLVLYQNLETAELKEIIEDLVNKIIFPAYYKNIPISFFSKLDRTEYSNIEIKSSLIHHDYNEVIRLLLIEQIDNILKQTNFIFSTPREIFDNPENVSYTPIELIFKEQLEKENVSFTPQARIGRFYVDFIVELNGKKLIVECDGRDCHNPNRDKERDKELAKHGIKILRLTGSEIFHDIEGCIGKVKEHISQPNYQSNQKDIDKDLDDSQKASIRHITGPIRVLAPAGSGKTKTLTNRIVHLINNGIPESQILALAFNKKAASEMAKRLSNKGILVSKKLNENGIAVRTFHSFGYEIIREYLKWKFDKKTYIFQTRNLMEKASSPYLNDIPKYKWNDATDKMLDALRRTKMELPLVDETTIEFENKIIPFQEIFYKYSELQINHNFLNYDDMIYLCLRYLLDNSIARQAFQNRFNYILVDEFQDLNEAQLLLMQILALPNNNLYIVGDDDQMIYGWRGAKISHILDFPNRYSESNEFILSTNYRSSKKIVKHSRWLIEHNTNRVPKDINPKADSETGTLDIKLSENIHKQAIDAADWIKDQRKAQKAKWNDFAVLFRYNEYQFPIAMILDSKKIPHSPVNNESLFTKNAGKDIYAYLTVILHPNDAKHAEYTRILKRPNKYFTNDLISKVKDLNSLKTLDEQPDLEEWIKKIIQKFTSQIYDLRNKTDDTLNTPTKLVSAIIKEFNFREYYHDQTRLIAGLDDADDNTILDIIISIANNFESIEEFYSHMHKSINEKSTPPEKADNTNLNEVQLASIHSTKGKEFKNIVYFNLSRNNKTHSGDEEEEERRVCYVGVTRAIKNILITAPEDNYSQFLPELLKNPKFKTHSIVQLNNQLAQMKLKEELKLSKIKYLKKEIETKFNSYPELKGSNLKIDITSKTSNQRLEIEYLKKKYPELESAELKVTYPIFKDFFIQRRLKSIEKAKNRIEELEMNIENIRNQEINNRKEQINQAAKKIDEMGKRTSEISNKELIIYRDEVEEIKAEIEYRNILNENNETDT